MPWIKVVPINEVDPEYLDHMYGIFKTKKGATGLVRAIADELNLCYRLLGMERGKGRCFAHQVGKCTGACVGSEKYYLHHLKLKDALLIHKIRSWPFEGRIAIKETNSKATDVHIFEHWCHLDSVSNDYDFEEAMKARYEKAFDLDFYRLIKKSINEGYEILHLNHF